MPYIIRNDIKYAGGAGSGSCNAVDLTMAEYEALEAAGKISEDTTYYITDASDGDFFSGIRKITQAEYDSLPTIEKYSGTYLITDAEEMSAKTLSYDGSKTGLGTNVQDAIDNSNSKFRYNEKTDMMEICIGGKWRDYKRIHSDANIDLLRMDSTQVLVSSNSENNNLKYGYGWITPSSIDTSPTVTILFPDIVKLNLLYIGSYQTSITEDINFELLVSENGLSYKTLGNFSCDAPIYNEGSYMGGGQLELPFNNITCKAIKIKFLNYPYDNEGERWAGCDQLELRGCATSPMSEEDSYTIGKEMVIGTWIDGSPIYRQTYISKIPKGETETWISFTGNNLVRYDGIVYPSFGYSTNFHAAGLDIMAIGSYAICVYDAQGANNNDTIFTLIVDYTKSYNWLMPYFPESTSS